MRLLIKIILAVAFVYMLAIGYVIYFYATKEEPVPEIIVPVVPDEPEPIVTIPDKPTQSVVLKEKEKTVQQSEEEREQLKMDMVTGKKNIGVEDTQKIIREYLYECYLIDDTDTSIGCLDVYYNNNDEEYVQAKEECADDSCLNEIYFEMAEDMKVYCNAITNDTLHKECEETYE